MKHFRLICLISCLFIYGNLTATNYTVVNTGDNGGTIPAVGAGTGTLRQAIIDVNADATVGPHIIDFNIPAAGLQTISLTAVLPTLTHSNVTIDGYTQTGSVQGNFGTRVFKITIDGSSIGSGYAMTITASNILFRGFVCMGTAGSGISFLSIGVRSGTTATKTYNNVKVQGCIYNMTATGGVIIPTPASAGQGFVHVFGTPDVTTFISSASNIIIGTDGDGVNDDNEGNLIALPNSGTSAIRLDGVDNSKVSGNWEGVNAAGTDSVFYLHSIGITPTIGIWLENCMNCIVGTNGDGISDAIERNVVADGRDGIEVAYNYPSTGYGTSPYQGITTRSPGNNMVTGNYVGTFVDGLTPTNKINEAAIIVRGVGNYIGCNTSELTNNTFRNIVSAATSGLSLVGVGIWETGIDATQNYVTNVIKGNNIGIGANDATATKARIGLLGNNAINSKYVNNYIGNTTSSGLNTFRNTSSAPNNSGVQILNNVFGLTPTNAAAPILDKAIRIRNGTGYTISNNIITNATNAGIALEPGNLSNTGGNVFKTSNITITKNSIYNNIGLGIDLYKGGTISPAVLPTAGVTANDGLISTNTVTTDPNFFIDYPIITAATINVNNLTVTGFVGSAAGQATFANVTVEFFIANNTPADQNGEKILHDGLSVGHGEGQTYLGSLTTDANGNFTGTLDVTGKGITTATLLTSTATDAAGNTSEFGVNYSSILNLPITLISFDVSCNGGSFNLNWKTANEINNKQFEVQKSLDGISFNSIASVAGNGNSSLSHTYNYKDNITQDGKIFYRLKQIDIDGHFTLSDTKVINNCAGFENMDIKIFPQPVGKNMQIQFLNSNVKDITVVINNTVGQSIIKKILYAVNGYFNVDIAALPSGLYSVNIVHNGNVITKQIVKE